MPCDTYMKDDARSLLANKCILMCGSSNMRGLYKDLVWLLEEGTLITQVALQRKNEVSHCSDERLTNEPLRNSRDYVEVRDYKGPSNRSSGEININVRYQFLTRLYLPSLRETLLGMVAEPPDVLFINSTLWDISRWGSDGVEQFKINLDKTINLLLEVKPPKCLVIWKTALPTSFTCVGSLITPEIQYLRTLLPFHIMEANRWAAERMRSAGFDVLDVHYQMRFMQEYRCDDGIHFRPQAVRYMVNMLLTHLALSWNRELPGNYQLDELDILRTGNIVDTDKKFIESGPSVPSAVIKISKAPEKLIVPSTQQCKPTLVKKPKRLQRRNNRHTFNDLRNNRKWSFNNDDRKMNQQYHNRRNNHQYYYHDFRQ